MAGPRMREVGHMRVLIIHHLFFNLKNIIELRSPSEIIELAADNGHRKAALVRDDMGRLVIQSILAGVYVAFGGILSVIAGRGFPEASAANPALGRLLSGAVFPIGLILVVVLGAELFTGNNAMLIPSYMRRRHSFGAVMANWTVVYLGNFVGALAFAFIMVYACGLTAPEPWHSAIAEIAQTKVSMPWLTVFLRGIGANWCVCLALWLAMSGHSLIEKMAACWFPVMMFVVLGYEHSIANMFFIPCGMMEGADVGVWQAVWNNLIPATLGNIVGGALLVGAVYGFIHRKKA